MSEKQKTESKNRRTGKYVLFILIILLGIFSASIIYVQTREDPEEIFKKNSNLRVEVLNGCGVNRLALKVTNLLRERGFNVVTIGDTDNQYFEETVVIERRDKDMKNAKYFAKRIGCKNIGKDIDSALYLEITVIIGKDYKKLFPDVEKEF
ncbi:MAG TPA: LytR family transcriptional regulator [candidate division WOR-3 bacterium]|uniref:LytR family transcriptional regulator n=1 Tax=candidate division WOR-3 bacterium TaxID=2052148 RepID=A0A9C9ENC7_UNCW3|nr:LytR family transcriptional regulator [candidate division WOR-3 bacterium]